LARCAAIKPNGERCKVEAIPDAEWCWSHHPDHAEQRRRRAARAGRAGGRGRTNHELIAIKNLLENLTNRVLQVDGYEPISRGAAAIANQLINTRLRAIEQERKNKETEDLEARVEALERAAQGRKGAKERGELRETYTGPRGRAHER
jgi:hypothetical protein